MNNLKILIVEDESLIALELTETIKLLGYSTVNYATTLRVAKQIIDREDINLIIMDINLNSTITGVEFYKELKRPISIIYVTAYRDDLTIEEAVSTKPLGYLIKPVNDDELKVLLKIAESKVPTTSNLIKLNDEYIFHKEEEKLFYKNEFINLGKKELKLLKLLLSANEKIVSFTQIEDEIWENQISSSAIRTLVYRLRSKLGQQFIETEFNYGIKLLRLH